MFHDHQLIYAAGRERGELEMVEEEVEKRERGGTGKREGKR